jgi:hypothetical protein
MVGLPVLYCIFPSSCLVLPFNRRSDFATVSFTNDSEGVQLMAFSAADLVWAERGSFLQFVAGTRMHYEVCFRDLIRAGLYLTHLVADTIWPSVVTRFVSWYL